MDADEIVYYAFLVRIWRSGTGLESHWHASLEDTHTSERLGFASLDMLFAYVQERIGNSSDQKGEAV